MNEIWACNELPNSTDINRILRAGTQIIEKKIQGSPIGSVWMRHFSNIPYRWNQEGTLSLFTSFQFSHSSSTDSRKWMNRLLIIGYKTFLTRSYRACHLHHLGCCLHALYFVKLSSCFPFTASNGFPSMYLFNEEVNIHLSGGRECIRLMHKPIYQLYRVV